MQIFVEILKLIAVSLAPGLVAILIYIVDKKIKKLQHVNKYVKQIVIGLIFAAITMLPFYCGIDYMKIFSFDYEIKGKFGPILASPLISSVIFGWPAGLTTGIVGFIWRGFAVDIHVVDYLRFGDAIAILVAAIIGILITKFVSRKNTTPKWTYGIILGLIIESVHMLLIFPIVTVKYNDLNFAYQIINNASWISFLSTTITVVLAFLWINIFNKQKIRIFSKQTKLSSNIQKRLTLFFTLAVVITFATTSLISYFKAYSDAYSDLLVSNADVVNEIVDTTETSGLHNKDVVEAIVSNRRIRTNGFLVIAAAKDQEMLEPINNSTNETQRIQTKKNQIIAVPNYGTYYLNQSLYFNNDSTQTADKTLTRTVTFKDKDDKDVTCSASTLFKSSIYSEKFNKNITYLLQVIKTNPVKGEDTNEYYVTAFLTLDEAITAVALSMRISMYLEILVYSIICILIYIFMRKRVVNNIESVTKSLTRISEGKLNSKVNVRDYDEFSVLSDDINKTVDTLKQLIDDASKRIATELDYAKKIQQNSLPMIFPTTNAYDLYAAMHTAKQVGGDFFDYFPIDDKRIMILIADVSGKGIPAAMFMMRSKTLVKSLAQTNELTLDHIVAGVNDELNEDNEVGMFVTAWFGMLNTETGELEYVNAGHNPPLIRKRGKYSYMNVKRNCVLGVMPNMTYQLEKTVLKKNDALILYTDGVTEATSVKKELYSEARFIKLVNNLPYESSSTTIEKIFNDVDKFQKDAEQADDITILMIRFKPSK